MAQSEYQLAIGQRMRAAAEQAGYKTTVGMGEALGVQQATVSRWWRGERRPSNEDLEAYAAATGKPVAWLLTGTTPDEADRLEEILLQILDAEMAGQSLDAAFAAVTGIEDQFGRRDREALAAGTPAVREEVSRLAGATWDASSPDHRRQTVARLRAAADRPRRSRPASERR